MQTSCWSTVVCFIFHLSKCVAASQNCVPQFILIQLGHAGVGLQSVAFPSQVYAGFRDEHYQLLIGTQY